MRVFLALLLVGCSPSVEDCDVPDTGSYTYADEMDDYVECLEEAGAAACEAGEAPTEEGPYCDGWCGAGCYKEYGDGVPCGCD